MISYVYISASFVLVYKKGNTMTNEPYNNSAETAVSPAKDMTTLLMQYEDGILGPDETTQLFQELINSGWAWQLQGHYGRTARDFLLTGRCQPAPQTRRQP